MVFLYFSHIYVILTIYKVQFPEKCTVSLVVRDVNQYARIFEVVENCLRKHNLVCSVSYRM